MSMANAARVAALLPALVFAAGCLLALHFAGSSQAPGESGQAAITLLTKGYIGDPFLVPTGPTAHVSPAISAVLALVYAALGPNTPAARAALGVLAAALFATGLRLAQAVGGRTRVAALAAVLAFPFLFQAVVPARQWDQPIAALLAIAGWAVYEHWRDRPEALTPIVLLSALAGAGGLVSPAILPPLAITLGVALLRQTKSRVRRAALATVIVAALLLPWAIRNELVLGTFIPTRSNFGLELALGNTDGARGWSETGSGFARHPHDWLPSAQDVARLGEVRYMAKKAGEAHTWIAAHPQGFAWLTARRAWFALFPSREMSGWLPVLGNTGSWILLLAFGAAKVGALAVLAWRRSRFFLWGLLFSVGPLLPYVITHINLRYELVTVFTSLATMSLAISEYAARRSA